MAIYKTLSLASGGGILSRSQQAAQARNTATVLIGLGGTGIDALRTVKTQVHRHLQPDDPDAVHPEYAHIRFLGIDTAAGEDFSRWSTEEFARNGLLPLDPTEYFSIFVPHLYRAISDKALSRCPEFSWFCGGTFDGFSFDPPHGGHGSRHLGRFQMMLHSAELLERLETEIDLAKQGFDSPEINIHILTGLCGATGSGCFLDVCYLVRDVLARCFPENTATVSGCFYLPDVNLDRVPPSDISARTYIPRNGCAALRELDYCMGFPGNGGGFTQEYQRHRMVDWKEPPVDLCFLLGATDSKAVVRPNAYEYAMRVTAEFLLTLLADNQAQPGLCTLRRYAGACFSQLEHAFPDCGNIRYCTLGGAAAEIPHREINTYLASQLFEQFGAIQWNIPTQGDVEALAIQSFARDAQSVGGVYESLLRELRKNAGDDYAPYQGDWKSVRDCGNAELVTSYTDQTTKKLTLLKANAKRMVEPENKDSLLGRLQAQLALVIRDIDRGPTFAYGLLSAAQDHNLRNLIKGLEKENRARWEQESIQTKGLQDDYDNAKANFDADANCTGVLAGLKASKLFQTYEWYLMVLNQHELALNVYAEMDEVLRTLLEQVEKVTGGYYAKLSRVMDNLIETFIENRAALASPGVLNGTDGFATPMMTIADLKQPLDAEVNKLNIPNMLDAFVSELLANEDAWINEDENKITRLVTKFFVEKAFKGYADRSITAFLQDKYNTTNVDQLTNKVYDNWMLPLIEQASPLFYFDGAVWGEDATARLSFLSVPTASAPVTAAAQALNMNDPAWTLMASAFPDRVSAVWLGIGLPIRAHRDCKNWERAYAESFSAGRHSYEGKPIPGMPLDDWRKLPPLIPDWERSDSPHRDSEPAAPAPHSRQDNESTEPARPAPQSEQAPPNETE